MRLSKWQISADFYKIRYILYWKNVKEQICACLLHNIVIGHEPLPCVTEEKDMSLDLCGKKNTCHNL